MHLQAIAQALLEGNCFSTTVATTITAETGADFEVIEGCERGDFSSGDASGSTDGSTAEGVRSPLALLTVYVLLAGHDATAISSYFATLWTVYLSIPTTAVKTNSGCPLGSPLPAVMTLSSC